MLSKWRNIRNFSQTYITQCERNSGKVMLIFQKFSEQERRAALVPKIFSDFLSSKLHGSSTFILTDTQSQAALAFDKTSTISGCKAAFQEVIWAVIEEMLMSWDSREQEQPRS